MGKNNNMSTGAAKTPEATIEKEVNKFAELEAKYAENQGGAYEELKSMYIELEAKNAELETIVAQKSSAVDELKSLYDEVVARNNDLEEANLSSLKAIDELQGHISAQNNTVSELEKVVADQNESLDSLAQKKTLPNKETVIVSGKEYKIMFPSVRIEGRIYSALDVKANPDLAQKLIEMNSKAIRAID